jgi:hypothetical protein
MNSIIPAQIARTGFRARGFERIFQLLASRYCAVQRPLVLIETGCVRKPDGWDSDGSSSVLFDSFVSQTPASFITIDINPLHCQMAQTLCSNARVICGDSVEALYKLQSEIAVVDFLYLDSFDLDWNNPHPSALHHLKELCAASPLLCSGSIVFVDDNRGGVGKGMYVHEYMRSVGAELVHDEYQVGFVLP